MRAGRADAARGTKGKGDLKQNPRWRWEMGAEAEDRAESKEEAPVNPSLTALPAFSPLSVIETGETTQKGTQ